MQEPGPRLGSPIGSPATCSQNEWDRSKDSSCELRSQCRVEQQGEPCIAGDVATQHYRKLEVQNEVAEGGRKCAACGYTQAQDCVPGSYSACSNSFCLLVASAEPVEESHCRKQRHEMGEEELA